MSITPSLVASRTTGVAPLYVHFDATGTRSTTEDTASKAFRNLYYVFDFGDPGAGTWSYGNATMNSKNEERGAGGVAAHVFETPGVYTVTLHVYDGTEDDFETVTEEITVTDPDTVTELSGSNIIVVATDGVFTGKPTNATEVTTSDISTAFGNLSTTKKKILFKRGQTWTDTGLTTLSVAGRVIVGAWGSGAKPIVSGSNGSGAISFADGVSDYSIQDLDLRSSGNYGISNAGDWSRILMLRVDMSGSDGLLSNEFSGGEVHSEIAFVDGTITVGNYTAYFASTKPAMLGSRFETTGTFTQNWRTHCFEKGIWAHNDAVGGSDSNSDMVKFGAPEDADEGPAHWADLYTELSVIRDNVFDDSAKNESEGGFVTGPEGTGAGEEVRYLVFERNRSIVGSSMATAIRFDNTVDCRIQNNLVDLSGGASAGFSLAIGIYDRETPTPAGNEVYNNTAFRSDNGGTFVCAVWVSTGGGTTHKIKNNLIWNDPGSGQDAIQDNAGGNDISNNSSDPQMAGSTSPFVDSTPSAPTDFQIDSGSYAYQGGAAVKVYDDYFGRSRIGVTNDMGFYQFTEGEYPWEEAGGEAPGDVIFSM